MMPHNLFYLCCTFANSGVVFLRVCYFPTWPLIRQNVQGFDSSGPIGALTPVGEGGAVGAAAGLLEDEGARKIWLEVDGARRQDSVLGEMVWSVPEMIARLSEVNGVRG